MASTENCCSRQRSTKIVGRSTWLFTGTSLVVMGAVAIAAGLVLQQQLYRSKCNVSVDCEFQTMNGIWFGIPIVFYGLLTISAGICRRKALMILLTLLSIFFILLNLTHLLLSEVSIMSSGSSHNNNSSQERGNETNGGGGEPQSIATEDGDHLLLSSLRFSPEDRIVALERILRRGDHDTKLNWNNNNDDHIMKYQHQPGVYSGYERDGVWPENTEERDHGMGRELSNHKSSGRKGVKFEEKPPSSVDVSSVTTTTLTSESIEEEYDDSIYESSGSGKGLDEEEEKEEEEKEEEEKEAKEESEGEDLFEAAGEEPERDEYDSYNSELEEKLEEVEGNKTAEVGEHLSVYDDWYVDDISWTRRKRELGGGEGGEGEEDCLEEEELNLQWHIQLMNCLMAVIRFIVLVLSIVLAPLILAPCCCYQKDEMEENAEKFSGMRPVTPVAATEKDDASQCSDDATLLQV